MECVWRHLQAVSQLVEYDLPTTLNEQGLCCILLQCVHLSLIWLWQLVVQNDGRRIYHTVTEKRISLTRMADHIRLQNGNEFWPEIL